MIWILCSLWPIPLRIMKIPRWILSELLMHRPSSGKKDITIRYLVEHMTSLSSVYALYQKYDEENLVLGNESDLQYFMVLADSLDNDSSQLIAY